LIPTVPLTISLLFYFIPLKEGDRNGRTTKPGGRSAGTGDAPTSLAPQRPPPRLLVFPSQTSGAPYNSSRQERTLDGPHLVRDHLSHCSTRFTCTRSFMTRNSKLKFRIGPSPARSPRGCMGNEYPVNLVVVLELTHPAAIITARAVRHVRRYFGWLLLRIPRVYRRLSMPT